MKARIDATMGQSFNGSKIIWGLLSILLPALIYSPAWAEQAEPWQMRFQPAATITMEQIQQFETLTLWIITPIVILVLGLLIWIIFRFNAKANPTPSKTSHNTVIEVIWTVVPVLILVMITIPSLRLLYDQLIIPDGKHAIAGTVLPAPSLTIKATGYQWYWGYEYSDYEDLSFDALMLQDDERETIMKEQDLTSRQVPRLLATDYEVIVPAGETVRLIVTAADVIHAFAMPAFGIKIDAVPGRANETWFNTDREGIYYGQCSELCGKDHAFMPIALRVVSKAQFEAWAKTAQSDIDEANEQLRISLAQQKQKQEKKIAQR